MTSAQYAGFRRDLLKWSRYYQWKIDNDGRKVEWSPIASGPIEYASALRSTRRQMRMLRDGYYRDGIY